MSGKDVKPKRVKLKAERRPKRPIVRLLVPGIEPIEIRHGTADGHAADLIDAPEGTKIERPKENNDGSGQEDRRDGASP